MAETQKARKPRVGFMISGSGTNMEEIIKACAGTGQYGSLAMEPVAVISSEPDAYGLTRAANHNLKACVINKDTHPNPAQRSQAMIDFLFKDNKVDIVICVGYLKKVGPKVIEAANGSIINIHPGALKYGGKGMHGKAVHQAVIDAKEEKTGPTVHIVDKEYDHGPILNHRPIVVVEAGETAESLQKKVLPVEYETMMDTLREILAGNLNVPGFDPSQYILS